MTPAQVAWARCRPLIEAALAYDGGFRTIEEVEADIEAGEAVFWPGKRSAIVTQFWPTREGKALHYWLCGGDLAEILDEMQPLIDAWGREQGCTRSVICGREGWSRVLKHQGFKPLWVAMSKGL